MMTKVMFYVVDINDKYQVIIYKAKETLSKKWQYDFYLCNGVKLAYQFSLPCKVVKVSELEGLAKSNYDNGNMCFPV